MDKLRFINKTSGHNDDTRSKFLSGRKLFWSWSSESHCDTKNDNYNKRNRYNKYIPTVIAAVLGMNSLPTMAETVGGVSATASPIANSSGSVTNQYTGASRTVYNQYLWWWYTMPGTYHERNTIRYRKRNMEETV